MGAAAAAQMGDYNVNDQVRSTHVGSWVLGRQTHLPHTTPGRQADPAGCWASARRTECPPFRLTACSGSYSTWLKMCRVHPPTSASYAVSKEVAAFHWRRYSPIQDCLTRLARFHCSSLCVVQRQVQVHHQTVGHRCLEHLVQQACRRACLRLAQWLFALLLKIYLHLVLCDPSGIRWHQRGPSYEPRHLP
jgi:hypothetical protein